MEGGLEGVRAFYDELADDYHLIYHDWRKGVARQGAALDRLLRSILGTGPLRVLDCACGIGTQAIGLATRGHHVTATDLSPASVDRARREAKAFAVEIAFGVADFRSLDREVSGSFDAVLACDNAMPHLVSDDDLAAAARAILATLRPGGVFVASIRDYDRAVRTRPSVTQPEVIEGPEGRRVVFQLWKWSPDGRTYTLTLFILREREGAYDVAHHSTAYRALLRRELAAVLREAGFRSVRWHTPEETGFFQPLVTARRP